MLNPPPVSPATFGKTNDAAATSDAGTFSFLALFKRSLASLAGIKSSLDAIGSSTTPVPVTANLKSGNYVLSSIGSPSITTLAANQVVNSSPFVPAGERVTVKAGYFKTGAIALGPDAYFWLECDPAGGTAYAPVAGTKRTFTNDVPANSSFFPSFVYAMDNARGGSWRVSVNMGTVTGTASGSTGFSFSVLN